MCDIYVNNDNNWKICSVAAAIEWKKNIENRTK